MKTLNSVYNHRKLKIYESGSRFYETDRCSGLEFKYVTIALFKETVAVYLPLYFVKINILSEECTRDCLFVEFSRTF